MAARVEAVLRGCCRRRFLKDEAASWGCGRLRLLCEDSVGCCCFVRMLHAVAAAVSMLKAAAELKGSS